MSDFVSKEILYNLCQPSGICRLHVSMIDQMPDADVRPVVHGRWIEKYGHKLGEDKNYHIHAWNGVIGYTCSICGRFEKEKEPFCNCGADMRGGEEE